MCPTVCACIYVCMHVNTHACMCAANYITYNTACVSADDIELQAMTEDTKDVEMDNSTNIGIHNEGFLPDEDQDNDISLLSITYHNNSKLASSK